jgi:hypothetical protein
VGCKIAALVPAPSPSSDYPRLAAAILFLSLVAGAGLRVWLALNDDGIYWPDEVYQSLEPAHWLVYGYGLLPWEYIEGMRNWTFAGFVALWLKLCQIAGADDPRVYLTVVRLVFGALSLGCAGGAYLLARVYGARRIDAAAGAALCALLAPFLYFATRAMSESAAALPVVVGLALALDRSASRRRVVAGAALVGIAVLLRLQAGVFAIGLLAILGARGERRRAIDALATLAGFAVLFGWLDHLTWANAPGARFDGWFHSAVKYLTFNLIEGNASNWGTSPWSYYFTTMWRAAPAAIAIAVALACLAVRRAAGLWIVAAVFVAAHVAVPHKELRFIIPAVPILCALAAVGIGALPRGLARHAAAAALVLAAAWSGARFHSLTFGDVGQYPNRAEESAYDDSGPVNRLLLAARRRPSLCGLRVDVVHLAWTGGLAYVHRQIPLFNRDQAGVDSGWISHVIAREDTDVRGEIVAREGNLVLVELPVSGCVLPPEYTWIL